MYFGAFPQVPCQAQDPSLLILKNKLKQALVFIIYKLILNKIIGSWKENEFAGFVVFLVFVAFVLFPAPVWPIS